MVLAITLTALCTVNCGGNDDDEMVSRNDPVTTEDPEGTIVANLTNTNKSNIMLGNITTIMMSSSNNFIPGWYSEIVCVGKVTGLSSITTIPESGWAQETAVIPGYGYVVRCVEQWDEKGHIVSYDYIRLFVVDFMESTSGSIMGCTIKYQVWQTN